MLGIPANSSAEEDPLESAMLAGSTGVSGLTSMGGAGGGGGGEELCPPQPHPQEREHSQASPCPSQQGPESTAPPVDGVVCVEFGAVLRLRMVCQACVIGDSGRSVDEIVKAIPIASLSRASGLKPPFLRMACSTPTCCARRVP